MPASGRDLVRFLEGPGDDGLGHSARRSDAFRDREVLEDVAVAVVAMAAAAVAATVVAAAVRRKGKGSSFAEVAGLGDSVGAAARILETGLSGSSSAFLAAAAELLGRAMVASSKCSAVKKRARPAALDRPSP